MIEFIPVILICSAALPVTECKEGNKEVTVTIGEFKNTPMACLIEGNTKVASLVFAPKLEDNYYVKVKCVPKDTREFGR